MALFLFASVILLLLTVQVSSNSREGNSYLVSRTDDAASFTRRMQSYSFLVDNCNETLTEAAGADGVLTQNEIIALVNEFKGTSYASFKKFPLLLVGYFHAAAVETISNGEKAIKVSDLPAAQADPLCLSLSDFLNADIPANTLTDTLPSIPPSSTSSATPSATPSAHPSATPTLALSTDTLPSIPPSATPSATSTLAMSTIVNTHPDPSTATPTSSTSNKIYTHSTPADGLSIKEKAGIAIAIVAIVVAALVLLIRSYFIKIKAGPVLAGTNFMFYTLNDCRRFWNETILRYRRVTVTNNCSGPLQVLLVVKEKILFLPKTNVERVIKPHLTTESIGGKKAVYLRPCGVKELRNPFIDFYVRGNVQLTVANVVSSQHIPLETIANIYGGASGFLFLMRNEKYCWTDRNRTKEWVVDDPCVGADNEYSFFPCDRCDNSAWQDITVKLEDEIRSADRRSNNHSGKGSSTSCIFYDTSQFA